MEPVDFARTGGGLSRRTLLRASAVMALGAGLNVRMRLAAAAGDERWHHAVGVARLRGDLWSLARQDDGDRLYRWRSQGRALEYLGVQDLSLPADLLPAGLVEYEGRLLVLGHTVNVEFTTVDSGYSEMSEADRLLLPPEQDADTVVLSTEHVHAVVFDTASGESHRLLPDAGFSVVTGATAAMGAMRVLLGWAPAGADGRDIASLSLLTRAPGRAESRMSLAPPAGEVWGMPLGGRDGTYVATSYSGGDTVVRAGGGVEVDVPFRGFAVGVHGGSGVLAVDMQPVDAERVVRLALRNGTWRESAVTAGRHVVGTLTVAGDPATSVIVDAHAGASLAHDED